MKTTIESKLSRFTRLTKTTFTIGFLLLARLSLIQAGSATWAFNPTSGDWNTAANWTPATVPSGPSDIATFGSSNTTTLFVSASTEVNEIISNFPYIINVNPAANLIVSGLGMPESSWYSTFVTAPGATMQFTNNATASNFSFPATFTNNGELIFSDNTTTGYARINNQGGTVSGRNGGVVQFRDNSSCTNVLITNFGGDANNALGGTVQFFGDSGGGNCLIFNIDSRSGGSGGVTQFFDNSVAPTTLTASGDLNDFSDGGSVQFFDDSIGDAAAISTSGGGTLDISSHNPPGLRVASISDSSGFIFLGANNLTVSVGTTCSAKIQDGGIAGGRGGSLTKVGPDLLTLSRGSNYSGGTIVNGGTVLVANFFGSATGTGPVQINAGTLSGAGKIYGRVTLGTGSGAGAFLSPGLGTPSQVVLIILRKLTFNADATYSCSIDSRKGIANRVVAKGVNINGALFSVTDMDTATLSPGTVFIAINNTSGTPIAGTFSNLADGTTIIIGSNTFQANYEGGDGNDLTLTVQ